MSTREAHAAVVVALTLAIAGTTDPVRCLAAGSDRTERPNPSVTALPTRPGFLSGNVVLSKPPSPREDLRVQVEVAVAYDSTSRFYTYTYTVMNDWRSGNSIESFGLAPLSATPVAVDAPIHWKSFLGWEDRDDAIVWVAWDSAGVRVPTDTTQTVNVLPSPYNLAPGDTLTGFAIVSRQPPTSEQAPVTWYAQGFDTLTDLTDEADEDIRPSGDSFFLQSVNGAIVGPDISSTVAVPSGSRSDTAVELARPKPNPSRGNVVIGYVLPEQADVFLAVYDVGGRRVAVLVKGIRDAGMHFVTWNGTTEGGVSARPGAYFTRLVVDGKGIGQQRLTILR